jgi:prevent-host-death family protein
MDSRIDAEGIGTRFGKIIDCAVRDGQRFVVDRAGEPAVVIMSVQDFIRTIAPAPDWLSETWSAAAERGVDQLSETDVESEIQAVRRARQR